MQKGSTEGEIHRGGCCTLRDWVRDKCHTGEGRQVPFGQHKKKIQEELERQQNSNRNSEEGLQGDEEENRGSGVGSRSIHGAGQIGG